MNFEALGLSDLIVRGLALQGVNEPTDVQERSIPKIIANKDVVIQSETGSGKTLAYLLPMYARMDPAQRVMQAIIVVPTRELAMQVHRQAELLSANSGIALRSIAIFGDVNIKSQIDKLREKPQIIIGTTGRIIELIRLKKIAAHTVKTVVIDEADKMLDISNIADVKAITKAVMRDTQIVMASASISAKTLKTAGEIAKTPELIKTTRIPKIPETIKHLYIVADARDKIETLRKLVNILQPDRAIAFINKAEEIDIATAKLKYHNLNAECIHGGNAKENHKKALTDFTGGKLKLLVASDLAARGLHIENIDIIFSLSISENPLDYLHRAGRTGRGGDAGMSIAIVSENELPLIQKYQSALKISIQRIQMHNGEITCDNKGEKIKIISAKESRIICPAPTSASR